MADTQEKGSRVAAAKWSLTITTDEIANPIRMLIGKPGHQGGLTNPWRAREQNKVAISLGEKRIDVLSQPVSLHKVRGLEIMNDDIVGKQIFISGRAGLCDREGTCIGVIKQQMCATPGAEGCPCTHLTIATSWTDHLAPRCNRLSTDA